jgi:hypothetical protein
MSDREKAIAVFVRKHEATSHYVREDGALIMTRGSGKKAVRLKVSASRLDAVEERLKNGGIPYRYELEVAELSVRRQTTRGMKQSRKRIR